MGTIRAQEKVSGGTVTGLADALFTKVQQRVLGVLFGNPGRSFYANEIIALAGCGTGAVQRELGRLAETAEALPGQRGRPGVQRVAGPGAEDLRPG
jgi:hypothetical protein